MKTNIDIDKCIAVGKNLIYKDNRGYILEVYEKTICGKDYYKTYEKFNDLNRAMKMARLLDKNKGSWKRNK